MESERWQGGKIERALEDRNDRCHPSAAALSQRGPAGTRRGGARARTDRALQLPTGHPNFRIYGPALGHAGIPLTHTGSALLVAPRGAPFARLPGLHAPGAALATVVVAGAGSQLPMGRLRGVPAGGRRLVFPLSQLSSARSRSLPPGAAGAL